jgi:hypothetical protein
MHQLLERQDRLTLNQRHILLHRSERALRANADECRADSSYPPSFGLQSSKQNKTKG